MLRIIFSTFYSSFNFLKIDYCEYVCKRPWIRQVLGQRQQLGEFFECVSEREFRRNSTAEWYRNRVPRKLLYESENVCVKGKAKKDKRLRVNNHFLVDLNSRQRFYLIFEENNKEK